MVILIMTSAKLKKQFSGFFFDTALRRATEQLEHAREFGACRVALSLHSKSNDTSMSHVTEDEDLRHQRFLKVADQYIEFCCLALSLLFMEQQPRTLTLMSTLSSKKTAIIASGEIYGRMALRLSISRILPNKFELKCVRNSRMLIKIIIILPSRHTLWRMVR